MKKQLLITAHSGCEHTIPNSMEYLKMAVRLPCDAIEIDVRQKGDGFWLAHDRLEEMTEESISLKEALTFLKDYPKTINCDLKEAIFPGVSKIVEELNMKDQVIYTGTITLEDLVCAGSQRHRIFLNLENLYGDKKINKQDIDLIVQQYKKFEVAGINIDFHKVKPQLVEKMRLNGLATAVWTVDEEKDMRNMMKLGVHSITTHEVRQLKSLMEARHEND